MIFFMIVLENYIQTLMTTINTFDPWHVVSNNLVCATSKCSDQPAYAQSDQSLCKLLEYSMSVKLLTEHHLPILSLTGGYTGSSEFTLVKVPHCWKSHVAAHFAYYLLHSE